MCKIILVIQDARSEVSDVLSQAIAVTEKLYQNILNERENFLENSPL